MKENCLTQKVECLCVTTVWRTHRALVPREQHHSHHCAVSLVLEPPSWQFKQQNRQCWTPTQQRIRKDVTPQPGALLLKVDGDSKPCQNSCSHSILEQTGISVGDIHSTMVNASSAMTRQNVRHNTITKGQKMHTLLLDADAFHCQESGMVGKAGSRAS